MKSDRGPTARAILANMGVHNPAQLAREDVFELNARIKQSHVKGKLHLLGGLISVVDGRDRRTVARED